MSAFYLVYIDREQTEKADLVTDDLAEALEKFCHGIQDAESAALVWSS